ncbi:MAG: UvrD-helicase domain-containing protein [Phycisphaerae bacterium]
MSNLLDDLNDPQRQAVSHVDGPLLILAGAGSGKTRVITRRVAYLMERGVAPWSILAITFTNKAAGEMQQRVEALRAPRGATLCTFHSLCARLLREFAAEAGVAQNYSIYDQADQVRLVKEAIKGLDIRTDNFPPARVHSTISHAKNELKTPDDLAAEAEQGAAGFYRRTVADVYRQYQRLLTDNNAMDFDDLLMRMTFLLSDRPDIRELLGRRYRYVLIDEYQDTNRAQYFLAHGIAMGHENICATGDPDQSIYAWRGADISNILEFEANYPGATVIRLEENYRSTQPILTAASKLIARNTMRKDKALWSRRTTGPDVLVVYCDDEHAEAAEVARRIVRSREAGGRLDEVAVFYRINSLSRVLEEIFRKVAIPYRIARGVEFYNRKEVKDVLAYLRVLVNPRDDLSCARIINTPARGIGAATVNRLAAAAESNGRPLLSACERPAEAGLNTGAAKRVAAFARLISSLAGGLDRPVKEVVEAVVAASGLEQALEEAGDEGKQARANVAELVSTAAEFDQEHEGARLTDFLHQVSLVSDADRFEGADGAVTFMTLHAAKGLEFPAVFIVGCESGLLPMIRTASPGRDDGGRAAMEEERRLAFVGMTRAKEELTLSCARHRRLRGTVTPQVASPFLNEIGTESVAFEDLTTEPTDGRVARHRSRGGCYEDADERAAIERAMDAKELLSQSAADATDDDGDGVPPPPPEYEGLVVNCRVRHPDFGEGKVIALRNRWPDTRAEIIFDRTGPKTIWLKHIRLELLDDWP